MPRNQKRTLKSAENSLSEQSGRFAFIPYSLVTSKVLKTPGLSDLSQVLVFYLLASEPYDYLGCYIFNKPKAAYALNQSERQVWKALKELAEKTDFVRLFPTSGYVLITDYLRWNPIKFLASAVKASLYIRAMSTSTDVYPVLLDTLVKFRALQSSAFQTFTTERAMAYQEQSNGLVEPLNSKLSDSLPVQWDHRLASLQDASGADTDNAMDTNTDS